MDYLTDSAIPGGDELDPLQIGRPCETGTGVARGLRELQESALGLNDPLHEPSDLAE